MALADPERDGTKFPNRPSACPADLLYDAQLRREPHPLDDPCVAPRDESGPRYVPESDARDLLREVFAFSNACATASLTVAEISTRRSILS